MKTPDSYIMPFGKFKGTEIGDVPASYLIWLTEQGGIMAHPEIENYIKANAKQLLREIKDYEEEIDEFNDIGFDPTWD